MAIESLMERRGTFDYILLETTGLADPGNIAPVFWVDDNLGSSIYLDGIVTLVDAKNILRLLDEPAPEEKVSSHEDGQLQTASQTDGGHEHEHNGPVLSMAHMQISHADVIILNKADLVTQEELDAVRERILSINAVAKIHVTDHSKTPQIEGVVLDLHAYDHLASINFGEKGHSHIDPVGFHSLSPLPSDSLYQTNLAFKSEKAISTMAITLPPISPSQVPKVDAWLQSILWDATLPASSISGPSSSSSQPHPTDFDVHRLKGILVLNDGTHKIIQAVRAIFEIQDAGPVSAAGDGEDQNKKTQCKIVLIGLRLGMDTQVWQRSLEEFLARD